MTARRLAHSGGLTLHEASSLTRRGLSAYSSNALLGFGRPVLAQHPRARLPPPKRPTPQDSQLENIGSDPASRRRSIASGASSACCKRPYRSLPARFELEPSAGACAQQEDFVAFS